MHTAAICFDDWPEWGDALGGHWEWGHSHHPPLGPEVAVTVAAEHPLVAGVDDFAIVDEVYGDLRTRQVTGLLHAATPGTDGPPRPLLWAREHGGGRVVYDALGHHVPSYQVPDHREMVRRAIAWATRG
jgi:type 1 glutamine amidotransferase